MQALAQTRQGQVRGDVHDNVYVFKGIPYAAPPFGAQRFRPPQPVAPWSGVREALTFWGRATAAAPRSQIQALVPDPAIPGEDCLNLNIWSPALGSARPVMVWIPGGMFEVGTGATYDGSRFARDGVVGVTISDPGWPRYELSRRATMRFDTTSEVVDDPRAAERKLCPDSGQAMMASNLFQALTYRRVALPILR